MDGWMDGKWSLVGELWNTKQFLGETNSTQTDECLATLEALLLCSAAFKNFFIMKWRDEQKWKHL